MTRPDQCIAKARAGRCAATGECVVFRLARSRQPRSAMVRRCLLTVDVVATLVLAAQVAQGQKLAKDGPITNLPAPVALDTTGMFQAKFVRLGDDIFIGGQPTEKALRDLKAQ